MPSRSASASPEERAASIEVVRKVAKDHGVQMSSSPSPAEVKQVVEILAQEIVAHVQSQGEAEEKRRARTLTRSRSPERETAPKRSRSRSVSEYVPGESQSPEREETAEHMPRSQSRSPGPERQIMVSITKDQQTVLKVADELRGPQRVVHKQHGGFSDVRVVRGILRHKPFARQPMVEERRHLTASIGDVSQKMHLGRVSHYAHWMHSPNIGRHGTMGRVHMVRPSAYIHRDSMQNHFMTELEDDMNMGRSMLRAKSNRIFRSKDPSRIENKTAHIEYRQRARTTEITMKVGISAFEINVLKTKLATHRGYTTQTVLQLIIGAERHNLGFLRNIDLDKLIRRIMGLLSTKRTVGLRLVDEVSRTAINSNVDMRSQMMHTKSHNYR